MYERIMTSTQRFKIQPNKSNGYATSEAGFDVMSADLREIICTVPTMREAKQELEQLVIQERLACPTGGCDD